jgi:hypothetical protein
MKKETSIKRSDDNTTLTISLAKSSKARIEEAAAADKRKISPWIAIQLEELLDEIDACENRGRLPSPPRFFCCR